MEHVRQVQHPSLTRLGHAPGQAGARTADLAQLVHADRQASADIVVALQPVPVEIGFERRRHTPAVGVEEVRVCIGRDGVGVGRQGVGDHRQGVRRQQVLRPQGQGDIRLGRRRRPVLARLDQPDTVIVRGLLQHPPDLGGRRWRT